jgi:hypothetical protein
MDVDALALQLGIYEIRLDFIPSHIGRKPSWSYEWHTETEEGYGRIDTLAQLVGAIESERKLKAAS